MSQSLNIAVLGAGIMGLSAAHALAARGHGITVFEKRGENASRMAGGMLAPYAEIEHMSAQWIDAGLKGIAAWEDFAKTQNIGFSRAGSLLLAHGPDAYILERFKTYLKSLPDAGETVSPETLEPELAGRFSGGYFLAQEAHLHPAQTMDALLADLRTQGAKFESRAEQPENIAGAYDYIIDCRGMGANDPELRGVKGEIALVHNPEISLSRPVRLMHPRYPLYVVPRTDGVYMIGATVIEADEDTQLSVRSGLELLSALYSLHPSFGDAKILEFKAGIRPSYPDNLPRIRRDGQIFRANGLFRHGYLLAPVIAACIADTVEGLDNRFISLFDGTYIKEQNHETHNQRPCRKTYNPA